MTNREAVQWLIDNKATYTLVKLRGDFCLRVIVKDPHGGEDFYTSFYIENSSFATNWIGHVAEALKESIDG
ncbi:hypothetical protein LCGC14_1455250 [marine sediment metagenome]|uniref:Uncharacterized protein n=1 Tax=marine sediment metagenome TaxID=412755 RepID=A0A0F9MIK0_9ZZZZ